MGLCSAVDALAAFGVVGCFNEEGGSRASEDGGGSGLAGGAVVPQQNVELFLSETTRWPQ